MKKKLIENKEIVLKNGAINIQTVGNSQTSNISFLMDRAQMSDLDFGLIRQNISIKKASFHYQGCPLFLKSGEL